MLEMLDLQSHDFWLQTRRLGHGEAAFRPGTTACQQVLFRPPKFAGTQNLQRRSLYDQTRS